MKQFTITEFIKKTILEIETALPEGYAVDESIDFEISVTTSETANGGIDLKVFSGKLSDDNQVMQKINFSIINADQQDKDMRKTGDNVIRYLGKGLKEISKIGAKVGNNKIDKTK